MDAPVRLTLCRIGDAPPDLLEELAEFLSERTGWQCRVGDEHVDPAPAFDAVRAQHDARKLLATLVDLTSEHSETQKILGLAEEDLGSPVFTFVFGEAVLGGCAAVVSVHRLAPERYGLPSDPDLFRARVRRVVLHETGHLAGLVHCRDAGCVMAFAGSAEELDLHGDNFCSQCRNALTKGPDRAADRLEHARKSVDTRKS